jgi:hypothetical protein
MSLTPGTHYVPSGFGDGFALPHGAQTTSKLSTQDQLLMKISHSILTTDMPVFGWETTKRITFRETLLSIVKQTGCIFLLVNVSSLTASSWLANTQPGVALFTPRASKRTALPAATPFRTQSYGAGGARAMASFPYATPAQGQTGGMTVNAPRFDGGSTGKSVNGARFNVLGIDPSFRQPASSISERTEPTTESGSTEAKREDQSSSSTEAAPAPAAPESNDPTGLLAHVRALMATQQAAATERERQTAERYDQQLQLAGDQMAAMRQDMSESQRDAQATEDRLNEMLELSRKNNEARTATGCESWLALETLQRDIQDEHFWSDPNTHVLETQVQSSWRLAYWRMLKRVLPFELLSGVDDHDVRAVYLRIIAFNADASVVQIGALQDSLSAVTKGTKSMTLFLDDVLKIAEDLETLKAPASVDHLKQTIRKNLVKEPRYRDTVSELDRNPAWDIGKWRLVLEGAARLNHDLVSRSAAKHPQPAQPALARTATSASPPPPSYPDSTQPASLTEMDLANASLRHAQRRVNQLQADQRAHPPVPPTGSAPASKERSGRRGRARAEKPPITAERVEEMKEEVCTRFILGKCDRGDNCVRKHLAGDALATWREKQVQLTRDTSQETRVCHQWAENGTCVFGDKCRFAHETAGKSSMCKIRTVRHRLLVPQPWYQPSSPGARARLHVTPQRNDAMPGDVGPSRACMLRARTPQQHHTAARM